MFCGCCFCGCGCGLWLWLWVVVVVVVTVVDGNNTQVLYFLKDFVVAVEKNQV